MADWSRDREYRQSSDGIEYCLWYSESRVEIAESTKYCGGFMTTCIGTACDYSRLIVCVDSYGGEEDIYYKLHEEQFIYDIRSYYPDISSVCAAKFAETFMAILRVANATHRCPEFVSGGLTTVNFLFIKMKPCQNAMTTELITSEYNGDGEEVVYPRTRPATRASIAELLKVTSSSGINEKVGECGICLEDMETTTMVRMPCSHPFHRSCLVRWLDNSNGCPICRFQMPAAQYQSDLDHCNSNS